MKIVTIIADADVNADVNDADSIDQNVQYGTHNSVV